MHSRQYHVTKQSSRRAIEIQRRRVESSGLPRTGVLLIAGSYLLLIVVQSQNSVKLCLVLQMRAGRD